MELACCEGVGFLSCQPIAINIVALGNQKLDFMILNKTLAFIGMVGDSINSYQYGSTDADVVITHQKGHVYGHAALASGESFVIEYCGNGVHVVKKLDVETLGENVGVDLEDDDSVTSRQLKFFDYECDIKGYSVIKYKNIGSMSKSECFEKCKIEPTCIFWVHFLQSICYLRKFSTSPSSDIAGLDYTKPYCHLDFSCITDDVLLDFTEFLTIQTSEAWYCDSECANTSVCVFWQWTQQECKLFKRYEISNTFIDSGTKYCSFTPN